MCGHTGSNTWSVSSSSRHTTTWVPNASTVVTGSVNSSSRPTLNQPSGMGCGKRGAIRPGFHGASARLQPRRRPSY